MAERVQLFSHEAERRVLSILSDVSVARPGDARALLDKHPVTAEDFHLPAHADVFTAMVTLIERQMAADPFSLWEALKSSKAVKAQGGDVWLTKLLVNEGFLETQFAAAAKTIRDLALRRNLWAQARKLQEAALDLTQDTGDVLAGGQGALAALVRKGATYRPLTDVLLEMNDELDEVQRGERVPVIATGIEMLDRVIGGLQSRKLTFMGALPGVGKSAIIATVAQLLAMRGVKVGIFSLEDHASWLGFRLLSQHSGVDLHILRHRPLNEWQLGRTAEAMQDMWRYAGNILLDDREALSPQEIANTARDMVVNRGVQVVLIDHAGEMVYPKEHRERHDLNILEGFRAIRAVAKQHDIPILIATHLTREAAQRKAPLLTDFPNSSAIERMARVALALTRDESGRLVVWVLKQTEGKANVRIVLDFHGPAALVKPASGFIDETQEAA